MSVPKFAVTVFSPWGKVRSLVLQVTPETTVEEFKWILKSELGLEEMADMTLEVEIPGQSFGEDLVKGTMKENNVAKGARITVISVEMEHGTNVQASPANEIRDNTLEKFGTTTLPHRLHDKGLNYEVCCPDDDNKLVVIHRGYGTFDWATDPLHLKCSCCGKSVNPMKVKKVGVNNGEWMWAGITLDGTKQGDKGTTGNGNHWILDDMSAPWRKLVIQVVNPNAEPEEEEVTVAAAQEVASDSFTCPLCKQEFPLDQVQLLMDRKLCIDCVKVARSKLADRDRIRLEEENEQRKKERAEKVEKVQLIGLGQQVVLKKAPPSQQEQQNQ